jgi:spore germination protein YaaH
MKKMIVILLIVLMIVMGYYLIMYEDHIVKISKIDKPIIIIQEENKISVLEKEEKYFSEIIKTDKIVYLPIKLLGNHNIDYDYDIKNEIITLSNRENLLKLGFNDENIKIIDDEVLIKYELLNSNFNIICEYNKDKRALLIKNEHVALNEGKINKKTFLFENIELESNKVKKITEDDEFIISKITDDWYYGYNDNLDYGYIKKVDLKDIVEIKSNNIEYINDNNKIIMTWEQVYSSNPNTDKIKNMVGLNVISPTWYKLINDAGDLKSLVSDKYISWVEENNYDIWVLVSNTFGDIEMTSRFLNDVNSREKFILNLIKECDKYNFKGVNIDFENIYMKDKNKFTQFISELSYEFSKRNIILSVDVTVMGGSENWSLCYDRLRISELVDYLVVMTYDEHWASSPISGSVASYKWVEKSLVDIIKIVNSEKVIMGIPLYTRIWYEEPSKKIVNKMDVTSKSITMQGQNNLLKETGLIPLWDDEAKQFYISYILDSKLKKVWLEEEVSIKEKAKLVNKLNLAGVAMWSRGFETENIWEVISNEVGD